MAAAAPAVVAKPVTYEVTIPRWIKFTDSAEGRDKFSKVLQYGSRLIMWFFLKNDPKSEWGLRFQGLFAMVRDARKLARLGKIFNEYQSALNLASKGDVASNLQFLGRFGMAAYWFFDNVVFLGKAKFLQVDLVKMGEYSFYGWFLGLSFTMLALIVKLKNNLDAETERRAKLVSPDKEISTKARADASKLTAEFQQINTDIVKTTGDWIVASNAVKLPLNTLGFALNDGVIGFCGLLSGLIASWSEWKKACA